MKRKCKEIDITDRDFIVRAIQECLSRKTGKDKRRPDIVRIFKEHGTEEAIADQMAKEIRERKLILRPVYFKEVTDGSNGKRRLIGIEDIKRQFYNYLCFLALEPFSRRIGEYQCTCLKGRGTVWGKDRILGWLQDPKIKWVAQCDIRKNYQSIDIEKLMNFLRKHIKNDDLLWLLEELLRSSGGEGLLIGSVLSVMLDALYLSQIYHYAMENLYKKVHHRNGKTEKIHLVEHALFFVDDQSFYCTSQKNAKMAIKRIIQFAEGLGLEIKPDYTIRRITETQYQDMLGYRIYRKRASMLRRDYIKTKRMLRKVERHPTIESCRSLVALNGIFVKHSDSYRFRKKYHTKRLVRKARRYISNYDKNRIHGEAAKSKIYDSGRKNYCANLSQ